MNEPCSEKRAGTPCASSVAWHIGFDALVDRLDGSQQRSTKAELTALEAHYEKQFATTSPADASP